MKPRVHFSIVVLVVAASVALYLRTVAGGAHPACTWQVGADEDPEAFVKVAPGTPLALHLDLPFPAHVYVASYKPVDGTIALFPSPWLRTESSNPLPSGEHRLPGTDDGRELSWPAPFEQGPTSYMVVLSRERLQDLEDLFGRIRQVGNMAFADGSINVSAPRDGGMDVVPPRDSIPSPILQAAFDSLAALEQGDPMEPWRDDPGIWLNTFRIEVVE